MKPSPRSYFTGIDDVNEFIEKLEEYISYNGIPGKNKYVLLKCPIKGDALLWLENIGRFLVNDDAKRYHLTVAEFKKYFTRKMLLQCPNLISKGVEFFLNKIQCKN